MRMDEVEMMFNAIEERFGGHKSPINVDAISHEIIDLALKAHKQKGL